MGIAEKIVSWPRFSLKWSPIFARDLEHNFLSLIFPKALNAGLPSFGFTRSGRSIDREHAKKVLKTRC